MNRDREVQSKENIKILLDPLVRITKKVFFGF